MRTVPMPDPAQTPDDELAKADASAWWSSVTARLLEQLDPPPTTDDDPAPAPGR